MKHRAERVGTTRSYSPSAARDDAVPENGTTVPVARRIACAAHHQQAELQQEGRPEGTRGRRRAPRDRSRHLERCRDVSAKRIVGIEDDATGIVAAATFTKRPLSPSFAAPIAAAVRRTSAAFPAGAVAEIATVVPFAAPGSQHRVIAPRPSAAALRRVRHESSQRCRNLSGCGAAAERGRCDRLCRSCDIHRVPRPCRDTVHSFDRKSRCRAVATSAETGMPPSADAATAVVAMATMPPRPDACGAC